MYRDILIIKSTNNFKCLRKQILCNLIPSINEFCRSFSWDSRVHQLFILVLQVQKEQLMGIATTALLYFILLYLIIFSRFNSYTSFQ